MKLQELLAANQPRWRWCTCAERGLKGILVCAERGGKDGDIAELDAGVEGKRASAAATIWSKFIEIYAGIWRVQLPDAHESAAGRVNNKIKVIKAYGIWI